MDDVEVEAPSLSDEALMTGYGAGDSHAFKVLYLRYKKPLMRYLLLQVGNNALVEEMLHDIWMSIINLRHSYQTTAKFKTLLYTIAHNKVIDYYRRKKIVITEAQLNLDEDYIDTQIDEYSNLESIVINEERTRLFLMCIADLPELQREVFLLKQESGLRIKEIAEVLSIDAEAAQSRLRYAKAKLLNAFKEVCDV